MHQQWVGVLHVQVHEASHGQPGEHPFDALVDLANVVLLDGGGDQFLFGFAGELVWFVEVFQGGLVVFVDDDLAGDQVDGEGDDGGTDVQDSDVQDGRRVFPVETLGDLHHDKHEDEVRDGWVHGDKGLID